MENQSHYDKKRPDELRHEGVQGEGGQQEEDTALSMVISVLANVVGGSLLLSVMFFLPHVLAGMLN